MVASSDQSRLALSSYLHNILDTPEHSDLRQLTALVEHLFHVPVAYMALLGTGETVVVRVGNGTEYAPRLGALQLDRLLAEPQLVRDSASDLPPGTDLGGLRFAASALLRATSGVQFGVLVIADRIPRPGFSADDLRALVDLASVLAGKMELRMLASIALEAELSLRESKENLSGIADCAPVPLIYCGADGACTYVNQAWLDFSGRSLEQERARNWISLIHADYRKAVMEECFRAFEAMRQFTAEAPMRRRDGQYRWILSKGAPRFRKDGSLAGYVGCLIDIAEYCGSEDPQACRATRRRCDRFCTSTE